MQMLKFLGIIWLIFISVIDLSSSTEDVESLSSECVEPLEYILNVNMDEYGFFITQSALINVSCTLPKIILYEGDCRAFDIMLSSFIEDDSTILRTIESRSTKENRVTREMFKSNIRVMNNGEEVVETRTNVSPEKYWINSTSMCTLENVAKVLITYTNKGEER